MRSTLHAITLAALVVLAGCAGGAGIATPGSDGGTGGTGPAADASDGTVRFYVSDRPEAIDEFRHLNVTVSRVGFQHGGENGSWTEYEVENRTVDLTRLRGDNATLVGEFPLENGTYTTVFVHVIEVNGTLESGERVNVKLPSEKLQIHKPFEVASNESVNFVFDIAVHKAGRSGKYILRPVIAQSGTDVPIDDVGDRDGDRGDDQDELDVRFVGNVTPGANATVEVTRNGSPVANATVLVNDEAVGSTDASGRLTFAVPADAEELEVGVAAGEAEGEIEVEFDGTDDEASGKDDGEAKGNDGNGPDDGEMDNETGGLTAEFVGEVEPGAGATVKVSRNGSPVANATVVVNGETVGTTDASGRLTFDVSADAQELTVEITAGEDEAELEVEFDGKGNGR